MKEGKSFEINTPKYFQHVINDKILEDKNLIYEFYINDIILLDCLEFLQNSFVDVQLRSFLSTLQNEVPWMDEYENFITKEAKDYLMMRCELVFPQHVAYLTKSIQYHPKLVGSFELE